EAAYGSARFQRLSEIKRLYDPGNLLRFNHNIPPAGSA
ncbi:MAG TPA: BBE domain-containing protein, partial [Acidimicrobiia bacterium]|nr:BBE domain-containing protein [Acidimicrobiia bacterium]